jgi:hypothetical protein
MSLATDAFTGNRYAFAGGNPISFVELDGHLFGMSWSDIGDAALDVVGMVPVVGGESVQLGQVSGGAAAGRSGAVADGRVRGSGGSGRS